MSSLDGLLSECSFPTPLVDAIEDRKCCKGIGWSRKYLELEPRRKEKAQYKAIYMLTVILYLSTLL